LITISSTSSSSTTSLTTMERRACLAVLLVLLGCCSNVIFLEMLVKQDPGIGNLVTFAQFLAIALEGFVFTTRCGTVPPAIPFSAWATLVTMYFAVSVSNNWALNFAIPMPLHMIFRAGSLMANMLLGMWLLGKRYSPTKYLSVAMITVGICTCTYGSTAGAAAAEGGDAWMAVGIGLLTFALFMSARMGLYQEVVYARYGKHPREALFYTHALPLPGFLLLAPDILHHWGVVLNSPPTTLLGLSCPSMLLHLFANLATQHLCISAVFVLTTECASLTVTLVVTLRKFLSLLFSIWYFSNPFTLLHWLGTSLVFGGTILFSDLPSLLAAKDKAKTS